MTETEYVIPPCSGCGHATDDASVFYSEYGESFDGSDPETERGFCGVFCMVSTLVKEMVAEGNWDLWSETLDELRAEIDEVPLNPQEMNQ